MTTAKILLASAIAFVVAVPAYAANQLKAPEMLGTWCMDGESSGSSYHHAIPNMSKKAEFQKLIEKCGDGIFTIKSDRLEGWEYRCRYLSVQERKDDSGNPTAKIVATCIGEACTSRETMQVFWSKSTLIMRTLSHGRAQCEG